MLLFDRTTEWCHHIKFIIYLRFKLFKLCIHFIPSSLPHVHPRDLCPWTAASGQHLPSLLTWTDRDTRLRRDGQVSNMTRHFVVVVVDLRLAMSEIVIKPQGIEWSCAKMNAPVLGHWCKQMIDNLITDDRESSELLFRCWITTELLQLWH